MKSRPHPNPEAGCKPSDPVADTDSLLTPRPVNEENELWLLWVLGVGGCLFCSIVAAVVDQDIIRPCIPKPSTVLGQKNVCYVKKLINSLIQSMPL